VLKGVPALGGAAMKPIAGNGELGVLTVVPPDAVVAAFVNPAGVGLKAQPAS